MTSSVTKTLLCGLLGLPLASPVNAQTVPEGIHRDARGPAEMCGLTGRDARDLIERVRASLALRQTPIDSDRFEVFSAIEGMDQWVITRPSEPAYPTVTCRHVYEENGSWYQTRGMRCDSTREACDRLFLEFQALDEQLRQDLSGRR